MLLLLSAVAAVARSPWRLVTRLPVSACAHVCEGGGVPVSGCRSACTATWSKKYLARAFFLKVRYLHQRAPSGRSGLGQWLALVLARERSWPEAVLCRSVTPRFNPFRKTAVRALPAFSCAMSSRPAAHVTGAVPSLPHPQRKARTHARRKNESRYGGGKRTNQGSSLLFWEQDSDDPSQSPPHENHGDLF